MTKPQIKGDALRQQDSQIPPMIDNKSDARELGKQLEQRSRLNPPLRVVR
jgi:hypothetical protein